MVLFQENRRTSPNYEGYREQIHYWGTWIRRKHWFYFWEHRKKTIYIIGIQEQVPYGRPIVVAKVIWISNT